MAGHAFIGNEKIKHMYLGDVPLKKGYIGNENVFSTGNLVTYKVDTDIEYQEEVVRESKAKMSFPTAFKLSFKNLISKRARTILVAIASSIGIIGVSTVLAVSFGVTNYIGDMQDDMLSAYPVSIAEEAVDYTSLISGLNASDAKAIAEFDLKTQVGVNSMITYLMEKYSDLTNVKTNDMNHNLMQYIDDMPKDYSQAIIKNYGIDVTNNIFCSTKRNDQSEFEWYSLNGLTQKYIKELTTVPNFSQYASYVDLFTNFMVQMPNNSDYILNQYDLVGENSRLATNANEIVLVLDNDNCLTDLTLAQLGFYNHDEFLNVAQRAVKTNEAKKMYENKEITKEVYEALKEQYKAAYPYRDKMNLSEIIGSSFMYYPHKTLWSDYSTIPSEVVYNTEFNLVTDTNRVVHLTYPYTLYGQTIPALTGFNVDNTGTLKDAFYLPFLNFPGMPEEYGTFDPTYPVCLPPVMNNEDTMLSGYWREITNIRIEGTEPKYDYTKNLIYVDHNGNTTNAKYIPDGTNVSVFEPSVTAVTKVNPSGLGEVFHYPAKAKDEWLANSSTYEGVEVKITGVLKAKESTKFGCLSRGVYYTEALANKYMSDANSNDSLIVNGPNGADKFFKSGKAIQGKFPAYVTFDYLDYSKDQEHPTLATGGYAYALNGDLQSSISSMFSVFTGGVDNTEQNITNVRALCGLKAVKATEDVSVFDYSLEKLPKKVEFYPESFTNKDKVTKYLNDWNADKDIVLSNGVTLSKSQRKDITYTDTVQMIISVINTLISIVTSALVAFTSLSLVVSCFMIAVITYISVMERVKEIGVIRSLGGRKKDVIRLFTAENMMTGLASGLIGVGFTYLLSIGINAVIKIFGIPTIAALPWWVAIIMVVIAVLLNVLSGAIPSRKASKQDPVEALRSE